MSTIPLAIGVCSVIVILALGAVCGWATARIARRLNHGNQRGFGVSAGLGAGTFGSVLFVTGWASEKSTWINGWPATWRTWVGDHAMLSAVLLTVVLSGTYEFVVVKKLRNHSAKGV